MNLFIRIPVICLCVLLIIVVGCDDEKQQPTSFLNDIDKNKFYFTEVIAKEHQNFYGKWKLISIGGGISGQGIPNNFDYLEVKRFGIYGFIRDSKTFQYGRIEVDTFDLSRPSIFQIRLIAAEPPLSYAREYYVQFEYGGMQLYTAIADGYYEMYEREE